jgi:transposase
MENFKLKAKDLAALEELIRDGKVPSRVYKRARGLLALAAGGSLEAISKDLRVHRVTVAAWRDGYQETGLAILHEAPRSGRPSTLDGLQRAKITALACTEAPDGHSQWTLRLLADKVIELGYCEDISHTQVRRVLKKTKSNPTSRKRGASGR